MICVDEIIYDLIREQINAVKANPEILDLVFLSKTKEQIEQIRQFIISSDKDKQIRVVLHHPRDAADFPCYSIVLEGSSEVDQVIGAAAYDEIPISNMEDGWIGSDSDIFRENIFLPVDIYQRYSTLEVKDGRRSCHIVAKKGTSVGKGVWIDFQNSVLEGGYVSLVDMNNIVFWIKSNRLGQFLEFSFGEKAHREHTYNIILEERGVWEKVTIDISGVPNRDRDKVRYMGLKITNADLETNIFVDKLVAEKELGSTVNEIFLDNRYRIEVWSENADLTLALYTLLLWIVLKYRDYLENSWGLLEQRVEGGDIMPMPEYYPEFLYIRGLMFSCKIIETVPRESDLVAYQIKLGKQDWGY